MSSAPRQQERAVSKLMPEISVLDRFLRLPFAAQDVARIDIVMFDFPELVFVTRHGCEPWEQLAVKLMLKWLNLYYSTSAFAPKYYPKAIIDYANTRGAEKVLYAGYFAWGLSLERIFRDMPNVPLKDDVWPKFLYGNAARILGVPPLDATKDPQHRPPTQEDLL